MTPAEWKERVRFYLVDCSTLPGKAIDAGLVLLNIYTCVAYGLSTYDLGEGVQAFLALSEWVIVVVFAVEYILRFWAAEGRVRHFFHPYTLIDLVSILPVFSTVLDLRFLRVARIVRIFRFLRFLEDETFFFGRLTAMHLRVSRLIFTSVAIVFVASSAMFEAEKGANPQFTTLGDAVYYTIVTVTTVGFGDITPASSLGKTITILMIAAGVVLIPYHIGQLARHMFFAESRRHSICAGCGLSSHERDADYCRRCGAALAPPDPDPAPSAGKAPPPVAS